MVAQSVSSGRARSHRHQERPVRPGDERRGCRIADTRLRPLSHAGSGLTLPPSVKRRRAREAAAPSGGGVVTRDRLGPASANDQERSAQAIFAPPGAWTTTATAVGPAVASTTARPSPMPAAFVVKSRWISFGGVAEPAGSNR